MSFTLFFQLTNLFLLAALFGVLLVAFTEIGWRLGRRAHDRPEALRTLVGGIGAATLGVLGLLVGFTLSMAIARFDARRAVIVEEANAIGTLWLRAGLLEDAERDELRDALRSYVGSRIALSEHGGDFAKIRAAQDQAEALHPRIWAAPERASRSGASPAVLSALIASANETIDLHELRIASLENYVPAELILVLVGFGAVALGLAGWSFGTAADRGRAPLFLLAALITIVITLTMDLNRPHRGTIRVPYDSLLRLERSLDAAPR